MGNIPRVGESVVVEDYKFVVSEMDENRVSKVRMMKMEAEK